MSDQLSVLVTGSRGYLGGHVCEVLRNAGHLITEFNRGESVEDLLSGIRREDLAWDVVVHLAWYAKAGNDRPLQQRQSLDFTERLLRALRPCRFIFASTASVYGPVEGGFQATEQEIPHPNCLYTETKLVGEQAVRFEFPNHHVIFRFGSLMGAGLTRTRTDLVVNAFASAGYAGQVIECWNPNCYKPVLHVRDASSLILRAVEDSAMAGTFNAASISLSAREIAQIVGHLVEGSKIQYSEKSGPVRSCVLDCSKLRSYLPAFQFRRVLDAAREFETVTANHD